MKKMIFILTAVFCFKQIEDPLAKYLIQAEIKIPLQESFNVTATMYNPTSNQCDSDPLLTAGMYKIIPGKASQQKWIAMSRDMLTRWKGKFNYGDLVKIEGAGHKDGVYKVVDTMNKRFKNRIDFLEDAGTKLYKFENVKLSLCKQPTQQERV